VARGRCAGAPDTGRLLGGHIDFELDMMTMIFRESVLFIGTQFSNLYTLYEHYDRYQDPAAIIILQRQRRSASQRAGVICELDRQIMMMSFICSCRNKK
jgi:hypothetical protein